MEEVREQPTIMPANALNLAEENGAMSEVGSHNQESTLGKFKSVQALMDAYDNLQAEFTKKCQLLAQLKKDQEDNLEDQETQTDNQIQENVEENQEKTARNQEFSEEGLQEFLAEFEQAQGYAEEIKNRISSMQTQKSNPYAIAWAEVLLKNLKENGASSDPIINQYVLSDEKVRNKIIEDYLVDLQKTKPPIVISSQSGERLSGVMPDSPKTLADAKKRVEKMFS